MSHRRQIPKDLVKMEEEANNGLKELELLNLEAARIHIIKLKNIIISSKEREENSERREV